MLWEESVVLQINSKVQFTIPNTYYRLRENGIIIKLGYNGKNKDCIKIR